MTALPARLCSLRNLVIVTALALLASCSRTPPPALPVAGLAPWEVPESAFGTQRLFRARYDGPDGSGGFALTLHLMGPERYQARARHTLGKQLWSLEVAAGQGLWLDHRAEVYCRLEDRLELAGDLLEPLPFRAFPALLLGRLPEPPRSSLRRRGSEVRYAGAEGRAWSARLSEGRVVAWTLRRDARPVVWWQRRDGEAILSDRQRGVQLSWREVVREPLGEPPEPLTVPAEYREVVCSGVELSVPMEDGGAFDSPSGGL